MTKPNRSKPQKQRRAPNHLAVRLVFYFVGAAAAVAGVAGYIIPELPNFGAFPNVPWAALVLATLTALSALVVPVTCELIGRSWRSLLFVPAALVFGGINAYSFHHAVEALIEAPRIEAHDAEHIAPLRVLVASAQAAVDAHLAPVFPDTMGPKNIAARMEGWRAVDAPLQANLAKAEGNLETAPAYEALVSNVAVWTVAVMIDLSIALTLMGVGLARVAGQRKIDAGLLADLLAKREAKRQRDAAAKVEAERVALQQERAAYLAARRAKRAVPTTTAPTPASPAPAARAPRALRIVS